VLFEDKILDGRHAARPLPPMRTAPHDRSTSIASSMVRALAHTAPAREQDSRNALWI
jgi:hypothetical protein